MLLANCSGVNRSHVGAVLGGTTSTAVCVEAGITDPYAAGACAVVGAFAGANVMYKSDYDVHNACLLYTSPSPRDLSTSRMPSSA